MGLFCIFSFDWIFCIFSVVDVLLILYGYYFGFSQKKFSWYIGPHSCKILTTSLNPRTSLWWLSKLLQHDRLRLKYYLIILCSYISQNCIRKCSCLFLRNSLVYHYWACLILIGLGPFYFIMHCALIVYFGNIL